MTNFYEYPADVREANAFRKDAWRVHTQSAIDLVSVTSTEQLSKYQFKLNDLSK